MSFRNQQGFSMIDAMIALGFVGLLSALTMQSFEFQAQSTKTAIVRNEALDARQFVLSNFSCSVTSQQQGCQNSSEDAVALLSESGKVVWDVNDARGHYRLRGMCGENLGMNTVRVEYDQNYYPGISEELLNSVDYLPDWQDLFDGIPVACPPSKFGVCPMFETYSDLSSDGRTNTACFPVASEDEFQATLILVRDTSTSMRDYNSAYGRAVASQLALEAANYDAVVYECSSSRSGNKPIRFMLNTVANFVGATSYKNDGYCSSSIRNHVRSLTSPRHLILFLITDHAPHYPGEGAIPQLANSAGVRNYVTAIENVPNIASVTIHGAILARHASFRDSWRSFEDEGLGVGHLTFDTSIPPHELFQSVAETVTEKKILRTVELNGLSAEILSPPAVYLNKTRLDPSRYHFDGDRLILSDDVPVELNDVVLIRY